MKLTLLYRKNETPDVESFVFQPSQSVAWQAGQYFHYVLHHRPTDDRGSDRWFTVASAPYEQNVMVTTRFTSEKGSSFKTQLKDFKAGDSIEVSELEGSFTLDDLTQEYIFIAGGIGITPFRSILLEHDHQGHQPKVTLLYANKNQDVVYKEELEALAKNNPHFKLNYIFSPDHIDEDRIKAAVPDLQKPFFYVSGPEPMVNAMAELLVKIGVPTEHLKRDSFPGYPEN